MKHRRLPPWLKVTLGSGANYSRVREALAAQGLHTVCGSARCPNLGECWSAGTATFLILGDHCTRNCGFCAVDHGNPAPPDPDEPLRLVEAVRQLDLNYAVITSVTRDDLPDGGAGVFAACIRALRREIAGIRIEVLIPDFQGDSAALRTVIDAGPDVLNHNIETVPRLYRTVRPQANYRQSLDLLTTTGRSIGENRTKSGMMLGMGETREEIIAVMKDLRQSNVGRLTLGQYLQPTRAHLPVVRYLPPEMFDELGDAARELGFEFVASGPLVRSSYHADDMANINR